MKNPFVKKDKTLLITAIAVGAVAAGAATYLYLTDSGASFRGNLKKKAKKAAKDVAAGAISRKTGLPKKHTKKAADAVA